MVVFNGGYALESVVRSKVLPEDGTPHINFLTRMRCNARLFALLLSPGQWPKGKQGSKSRKWDPRLDPPYRSSGWKTQWQFGTTFIYGRQRTIR